MTKWLVYVNGAQQPGMIDTEIIGQNDAVLAWTELNGERPGSVIHATSYIPFNKRKLGRHLAPVPQKEDGDAKAKSKEQGE